MIALFIEVNLIVPLVIPLLPWKRNMFILLLRRNMQWNEKCCIMAMNRQATELSIDQFAERHGNRHIRMITSQHHFVAIKDRSEAENRQILY
jgi:hypothetical protein